MSTEIQDTYRAADHLRLATKNTGEVEMRLVDGAKIAWGEYLPANLIAAVEAECGVRLVPADAVVVLREELPPVVVESKASGEGGSADAISAAVGHMFVQRYASATPAILRSEARCLLALAEHIDQHPPVPPVDEVQVEALAGLLADEVHRGGPIPDARFFEYLDTARALIRKGVRMPEDAS